MWFFISGNYCKPSSKYAYNDQMKSNFHYDEKVYVDISDLNNLVEKEKASPNI